MTRREPGRIASTEAFLSGTDRRAAVADRLARHARVVGRTSAGLPVLALPAMAEAQGAEFVPIESVEGVASARPVGDGAYRLTLTNGTQVTVPAADIQIVGGVVQISAEAAATVAQVAAAAGTAGAAALAMGVGAAGIAAAASGGGSGDDGGDDPDPLPALNRDGALAEGPQAAVSSASTGFTAPEGTESVVVTFGDDGDDGDDPTEFSAVLGEGGAWSLQLSEDDLDEDFAQGEVPVTVTARDAEGDDLDSTTVTFDIDTLPPDAPAASLETDTGAADDDAVTSDAALDLSPVEPGGTRAVVVRDGEGNVVSEGASYTPPTEDGDYTVEITDTDAAGNEGPTTTVTFTLDTTPPETPTIALVEDTGAAADDLITQNAALAIDDAADGVTRRITVDGTDQGDSYTAPEEDGDYSVVVTDTDVAGNTATASLTFTLDTAAPEAPTVTLANDTGPDDDANTTTDPSLTFSTVPDGATREVLLDGVSQGAQYAAPSEDGAYTVTVRDTDAAGNVSADATVSFVLDTAAPTVTLDEIAGGTLDLLDVQSDLVITGTAEGAGEGAAVTVTFDGQDYTGTTEADDSFSVTVPQSVLAAIEGRPGDAAEIAVSATATDLAGNTSEPDSTTLTADFTGPSISIDPITGDDVLNAAEAGGMVTISGTTSNVPDGRPVTLAVNGTDVPDIFVSGGTWSAMIDATETSFGLGDDGASVTVTADVEDGAGLAAPRATATLATDLEAPTLAVTTPLAGDGTINIAERDAGITVEGTTDAEDGQTVTLDLGGADLTGTVQDGAFAIDVDSATLAALPDGEESDFDLSVTDAAGNETTASASADTDYTAPNVALTSPVAGDVVNLEDRANGSAVEGTSDAPDGTTVTVSVRDSAGDPAIGPLTGTVTGGAFSVPVTPDDLAALADDETYTVEATVVDAAGNAGTSGTVDVSTDYTAPSLALDPLSVGADLDAREQDAPLTVTGTSDAIGRTVTVTLDGTTAQGTVQADGTWSAEFTPDQLDGLPDAASLTVSAEIDDPAGNAATEDAPLETDFTPIVTLDPVARNGAFDLADARDNGLDVSGQAFGLPAASEVDVEVSAEDANGDPLSDSFTAPIGLDGSWSGNVAAGFFDEFATATDLTISVRDAGGAATPATETVPGVAEPDFFLVQTQRQGDIVTFGVVESPSGDQGPGTALGLTVEFDPADATYVEGSDEADFGLVVVNSTEAASGEVTFGLIDATAEPDEGEPFFFFDMQAADADTGFALTGTDDDGDFAVVASGTSGADTIEGLPAQIALLHGNGGDDEIDLSDPGPKVVVFDPDPAANGVDTIREFTTSDEAGSLADAILLAPDDPASLRGDGTGVEQIAEGGTLGANTGFAVFTTALASTEASDIETAVEGLEGEQAGDTFYVLASDGTDSVLAQVTFAGADDATVDRMGLFEGEDDVAALGQDVIFPDASVVYNT